MAKHFSVCYYQCYHGIEITPQGVLEFVKGAGILTDLTGCDDCLENTFDCWQVNF